MALSTYFELHPKPSGESIISVQIQLIAVALATAMAGVALAQSTEPAPSLESIQLGAKIYQNNCSPCHGTRMADPQGAFDLRIFPRDAKPRFVLSVTKGKNSMPPWGDLFNVSEIDALWNYVIAGEK